VRCKHLPITVACTWPTPTSTLHFDPDYHIILLCWWYKKRNVKFLFLSSQANNMNTIAINVGGTVFTTTRKTLLTVHNGDSSKNFFHTLVDSSSYDQNNAPFIDRSPKYFEYILNYLRDGAIPDVLTPTELAYLRFEAKYYTLTGLMNRIDAKQKQHRTIDCGVVDLHYGILGMTPKCAGSSSFKELIATLKNKKLATSVETLIQGIIEHGWEITSSARSEMYTSITCKRNSYFTA
jgi:hypothetical protein